MEGNKRNNRPRDSSNKVQPPKSVRLREQHEKVLGSILENHFGNNFNAFIGDLIDTHLITKDIFEDFDSEMAMSAFVSIVGGGIEAESAYWMLASYLDDHVFSGAEIKIDKASKLLFNNILYAINDKDKKMRDDLFELSKFNIDVISNIFTQMISSEYTTYMFGEALIMLSEKENHEQIKMYLNKNHGRSHYNLYSFVHLNPYIRFYIYLHFKCGGFAYPKPPSVLIARDHATVIRMCRPFVVEIPIETDADLPDFFKLEVLRLKPV